MGRRRASTLAGVLLLTLACGMDTNGSVNGITSPRDFRVTEEVFDTLVLSWTPSTSDPYAWYDVQHDDGGGPFRLALQAFSSSSTGSEIHVSNRSADLTTWTFRIHACGGRPAWACSAWNVATITRGVRPPTLTATVYGARAELRWVNESTVADTLSLERVDTALDGSGERVVPIALVAGANAYTDGDVVGDRLYRYRLRAGKDGIWSAPAETDAFRIDGLTQAQVVEQRSPDASAKEIAP